MQRNVFTGGFDTLVVDLKDNANSIDLIRGNQTSILLASILNTEITHASCWKQLQKDKKLFLYYTYSNLADKIQQEN